MELLTALCPLLAVFAGFAVIGWFAQRGATGVQKVLRFITGQLLLAATAVALFDGRIIATYIVGTVVFGATALVVERRYRAQHNPGSAASQ